MGSRKDEAQLRKHQIDTLKIFNDNVLKIKDDEEFSITFKSGDNDIKITIIIDPEPTNKPILIISPPLEHPWLDNFGNVTKSPGILNVRLIIL